MKKPVQYRGIIFITLLFFITVLTLQNSFVTSNDSVKPSLEKNNNTTFQLRLGNASLREHKITFSELEQLKSELGVYQEGASYNQLVNGYGVGLQPPTDEDWNTASGSIYVVDDVSYANAPQSVDNSKSTYFPPIGNQGSQGSCVAWSLGYYIATYQVAKENGWDLSGAKWSGGQPTASYQDKIISPAFVYNLINNGQDNGTNWLIAINLICNIGASSWMNMPYNQRDYTYWPSQAAWTEAPLYRGNGSGCQILDLNDDAGISNLKNLLASGNLGSIGVDANKFSNLSSNDVWNLDNYNSPAPNHAGTVVGYDDNFSYIESGQVRYGAFKVANSWGIGSWEPVQTGFYWISYAAMEQRISNCYYYFPQTNYQPDLLATFNIKDNVRSNCMITVGLGNPAKPKVTKSFSSYIFGGAQPFCLNNIVMDITEFEGYMSSFYNQSFFLQVYDNQESPANGTIMHFAVGNWTALGTPCPTVKYQNVFVKVTYNPVIKSSITLLSAGESVPLSTSNYFQVSYYLNGQQQVAYAQNGTINFSADSGTNLNILGQSSGSNSSEEWVFDSQGSSVTLPAGSSTTLCYYDLLSQQVAYFDGGESPISPILTYYSAPSTPSSQVNQIATEMYLPYSWQQTIMVLRGTTAYVTNNILGPAQDQWATPTSSWNVNETNQISTDIFYYHQYQVQSAFSTSDGSLPSSLPLLSGTQFGSNCQLPLSTTNQTIWLDENTQWLTSIIITDPLEIERWASLGLSGNVTETFWFNQAYTHQYYLTVTSPYGSPIGTGWYDAGTIATFGVLTPVSVDAGTRYVLGSWNGLGAGSYTGPAISYSVTMNSSIVEAANWTTQFYLRVDNGGYGTANGSGWYNSGSPTQAAILSNIVPGGAGTQYVFSGWTGDASGSGSTSNIITMNSPKTASAVWTTQYQLTFIVTPSGSGLITPTMNSLWVNSGLLSIGISPNPGYSFSKWTTNSDSINFFNSNSDYTTVNVNGPGMVTANLEVNSTPSPTPTPTSISSQTTAPTPTAIATPTSTNPTATPTLSPTPVPTLIATPTVNATLEPSPSPSALQSEFSLWIILPIVIALAVCFVAMAIVRKRGKVKART